MTTIRNSQISLYCHLNKILKRPGTSFQSPTLSQQHFKNVCHSAHQCLTKFHFGSTQDSKEMSNFHYEAMLMMTSQILKSVDFTKTQESAYLVNKTLFFLQRKKPDQTLNAALLQKNNFIAEVTFKRQIFPTDQLDNHFILTIYLQQIFIFVQKTFKI